MKRKAIIGTLILAGLIGSGVALPAAQASDRPGDGLPSSFGYNDAFARKPSALSRAERNHADALRAADRARRREEPARRELSKAASRKQEAKAELDRAAAEEERAAEEMKEARRRRDAAKERHVEAQRSLLLILERDRRRQEFRDADAEYERARERHRNKVEALEEARQSHREARAQFGEAQHAYNKLIAASDRAAAARANASRALRSAREAARKRVGDLLGEAKASGASVNRYAINWADVESRPGTYDFDFHDGVYERMLARGMRPLIIVVGSPCWAHPSLRCKRTYVDQEGGERPFNAVRPDEAFHDEWASFVAAVAERYPDAIGIELWNEPNGRPFWGKRPSFNAYLELLDAGYRAVKEVRPEMPVLLGGLFPSKDASGDATWDDYLRLLYENGAAASSDAVSLHPYPQRGLTADSVVSQLDVAREIVAGHDPQAAVWVTEVGISTDPRLPDWRRATKSLQARRLGEIYRALEAADVPTIIFHRLRDAHTGIPREDGMGVLTIDGEPKPAYCALSELLGKPAPAGC